MADTHDFTVGRWMLLPYYVGSILRPDVHQIVAATNKLVKFTRYGQHVSQQPKDSVIATFANKADAERLRDTLGGIQGERDRRIRAAHDAANDAAKTAIAIALAQETARG